MRRHGSLYRDLEDRLFYNSWEYDGHWLWLGTKSADGYGRISLWLTGERRRRVLQAHRLSYQVFLGPIPEGHDLGHAPDCPRCCIHPNHLTPKPWRVHRLGTAYGRTNQPKQLSPI